MHTTTDRVTGNGAAARTHSFVLPAEKQCGRAVRYKMPKGTQPEALADGIYVSRERWAMLHPSNPIMPEAIRVTIESA